MSEQETVKVYELAKELGLDSISLLDKLKGLNIKVKNHMSDLAPEELRMAREALMKKSAAAAKAPKTAKKAPVAKTTTKKKAATTETVVAAPPASDPATEKKSAAPVIRRRTRSEGGAAEAAPAVTTTILRRDESGTVHEEQQLTAQQQAEAHAAQEEEAALAAGQYDGASAYSGAEESEDQEINEALDDEESAMHPGALNALGGHGGVSSGTDAGSSGAENLAAGSMSGAASQMSSSSATTSGAPLAAGVGASLSGPELSSGAAVRTRAPVILPPRPVAPRRSILKTFEPVVIPPRPVIKPAVAGAVGAKPTIKTPGSPDKDGYRIIKMTKENLDQMVEEEAAKKRGGGGREAEIRPEDVRFADYRKKEMVFLPKKKKLPVGKEIKKTKVTTPGAAKRVVTMNEMITVHDLANQLSVKATDVIRKLIGMGQMVNINSSLDFDTTTVIAAEYQHEVRSIAFDEGALIAAPGASATDAAETLKPRPPIVTIMGHVDHGKTTLLDTIREADVAGGEAGGITQHIGAYTVEKNGKLITFIDTPGHEAFTVMRARGANVTDIVILVVSADDGVMPQTREALSHAQAAKVPIIVAVNKIDKPGANPEKIKQGLAELNLLAEDWGGETMFIPVSALKKTNIDKLLEAILLQAEVLDLKSNPDVPASGTVLEARVEKGRGPVMSVLISRGTLHAGDPIVSGAFSGKVKAMTDDKGRKVKEAGPGFAVEVLGLDGIPNAGEKFSVAPTEADARSIAENRVNRTREKASANQTKITLEELFSKIQTGNMKELNVILKGDVFGSVEAIKESLIKLSNEKVKVKVLLSAPGGITESDVLLATASSAIIIGFNVRPETKARQIAENDGIEIKCYSIIYELLDDVKKAMAGLLDKKKVEKFLGRAEVRQIFSVPKIGVIAGASVIDGKIQRGANVRLLRESRVIYEGKMSSLRRFKDDAKEVATGFECGIGIENYNDLKPGDLIEAYIIELITPTLEA